MQSNFMRSCCRGAISIVLTAVVSLASGHFDREYDSTVARSAIKMIALHVKYE